MLLNKKQLYAYICSIKKQKYCFSILLFLYAWIAYLGIRANHLSRLLSGPMVQKTEMTSLYMISSVNQTNLKNTSTTNVSIKPGINIEIAYLLENLSLCSSVDNLAVLIIVHTAPSHWTHRQAIRRTWANISYYPELGSVRVLFLLGRVKNASLQIEIKKEYKQHGDILQGDFIDHYHNMTYKGVMAFRWLTENCKNAKIILKVDDDVIVNMFHFLTIYVPSVRMKSKYMICRRLNKIRIDRKVGSKWSVDKTVFKGQTVYPDFCQGFVVIISNDLIPVLNKYISFTPFFWIDDVYLYGLVPRNISGIQYNNLKYGHDVIWGVEKAAKCYKENKPDCAYLAVMFWSDAPGQMDEMWTLMVQYYKNKTAQIEKTNFQRHTHVK